ncbi:MAG: hypothetical protein ACRBBR_07250 [Cellvibrionaceae bacterium]
METQQKNIIKTVLIIVALMASILLLFLNKITTARYLSDVELKINGLILLDPPQTMEMTQHNAKWVLVANTQEQKKLLDEFYPSLRKSAKAITDITLAPISLQSQINKQLPEYSRYISVINTDKKLMAYFKPPFDQHKMLLTYSSIVAHR